jgi:hypothetical protein
MDLKKYNVRMWIKFIWITTWSSHRLLWTMDSINGREFDWVAINFWRRALLPENIMNSCNTAYSHVYIRYRVN